MRGLAVAVLAILTAHPASVLVVEGCEVQVGFGSLDCSLTNDSGMAVAELDFELLVSEGGRTVPWGRGEGRVPVYGGIEPGETVEFSFPVDGLPPPARGRTLSWEFGKLNARMPTDAGSVLPRRLTPRTMNCPMRRPTRNSRSPDSHFDPRWRPSPTLKKRSASWT